MLIGKYKRNILINKCIFNTIFASNTLFIALKLIYMYIYIYIFIYIYLPVSVYIYFGKERALRFFYILCWVFGKERALRIF